jgi:nitric-oxide synthase, brain
MVSRWSTRNGSPQLSALDRRILKSHFFQSHVDSPLSIIRPQKGITRTWENHEKIPACSIRTLLTRFMDITSPPSRQFLTFLSGYCEDKDERSCMEMLSTESEAYEDWKHDKLPHILEVFNEFPSCRPPAAMFIANLTALQPRFYSISSSQRKFSNEVHLTVAIVKYVTNGKLDSLSIIL